LKTPVHFSGSNFQDKTAPELGEDTDDVLKEVGFTGEQISSFRNKGTI
jgi:crotonobetainyl-CoA:carnitine CoA-transferase CaiB-like acyl-CoA transferase